MHLVILLALVAAIAYRIATPEERTRYLHIAIDAAARLKARALRRHPAADTFRAALRARTPRLVVTPAIAAVDAIVFGCLLFAAGALTEPDTLVGWGASVGPRTTNGEWWRLVTSTFVHTGALHLLVNVATLMYLGAILERLVGPLAFAVVYLSAGVFAGLVNLSSRPVAARG